MKLSLSKRIVGAVIISAVIGSTSALISTFVLMNGFNELVQKDVEQVSSAVQGQLDELKQKCREAAYQFAVRPDVAEAVKKGDTAYIQKAGKEFIQAGTVNVLTIGNKEGQVVGRGHSDKAGDSVLSQVNVKKALAGEAASGVEEGTVVKFSMRAGNPIKLDGQIIGTVTAGADLSSDTKFVDRVKETIGIECTIFHGDTRVSTTITREGKRVVGTKMDNPKIIASVLQQGKAFQNLNQILGREYNTAYWPLRDIEGRIAGMLFIGKDRAAILKVQREMYAIVGVVVLGIVALMSLAAFFIARSIAGPIQRVSRLLADSTARVASVSAQVSGASKVLSDGASEQAAAIEETSSSLEEMASMTKSTAENGTQADGLMQQVGHYMRQAGDTMGKLSASMHEIKKAGEDTQKIVKTIDEIAFQTNLLALNAAVEAARAGEAGAGFAVVADEVRNLAMRAAEAARNTAALIDGTVTKVNDGSSLMADAHGAFRQVAESAGKVEGLLGEIASAANEQSQGIDQVNTAVGDMDKVTQQNAANAEESSAAAEELSSQAGQMKTMVAELIDLIGTQAAKTPRSGGAKPRGTMARGKEPIVKSADPAAESVPSIGKPRGVKATCTAAEQAIPLEGDDFKDF